MKRKLIFILIFIIIIILLGFIFYSILKHDSGYYISGKIVDVIYLQSLSNKYIKVFFENEKESFSIGYVFESGCNKGLESVYLRLKGHIGDNVIIKYTKSLVLGNGFVDVVSIN